MRLAAIACACWLFTATANAEDSDMRPRLLLHAGLDLVVGPAVKADGISASHPTTGGYLTIAYPGAALRFEVPLSHLFVAGVQAAFMPWMTHAEYAVGPDVHTAFDFSVFPKARISHVMGSDRSELYVGVPIGPSLDTVPTYKGAAPVHVAADPAWGFHGGLALGYEDLSAHSHWAWVIEGGVLFHHFEHTYAFEVDGKALSEHEEVVYRPISIFLHVGGLLAFGSS
jgi:hypothetical protein